MCQTHKQMFALDIESDQQFATVLAGEIVDGLVNASIVADATDDTVILAIRWRK
jgi:hypothetical protein